MPSPKRWSIVIKDEETAPLGSAEYLKLAKQELKPFEVEHLAVNRCRCEECAEKQIRSLAIGFNRRRLATEGAPRKKDVLDRLALVASRARALSVALRSLDDYSRHWLLNPRKHDKEPRVHSLFKKAKGSELPTPSNEKAAALDGLLLERLDALDRYTRLMAETFKMSRDTSSKPDRGGNTNMFREHFGAPSWYLVLRAWELYEDFKRGGASTTENGSFHDFVYYVRVYWLPRSE
jgi:hypothetical protein